MRNDKLFGSLLDLFAGEPLIDWIEGFHFIDLFKIYNDVETIINIRATINDLEKNVLHHRFANALKGFSTGRMETTDPIIAANKLRRLLNDNLKKYNTPIPLRIMAEFDMKALKDVLTTLDWMNFRGAFPQGKVYSSKKVIRGEQERLRLRKEKKSEQEERARRKKKTEEDDPTMKLIKAEEKKAKKAADFEKLKLDILAQTRGEPIRKCPSFNFVEPAPGCHYDIGNSLGYVLIPIPAVKLKDIPSEYEGMEGIEVKRNDNDFLDIFEEEKEEEKTNFMRESGTREMQMEEMLNFIHESAYNVTEQLFDNLGGKIDTQIITITQWGNEDYYENEVTGERHILNIRRNLIHNTKFFGVNARNEIFPTSDHIVESLKNQYLIHVGSSESAFIKGLVMKLQYRINRSHEKKERTRKYKGGSYIDHFDIPCFTKKLRTTCVTRMNNYNVKKEATYIYNIVNPNDNLCFLRYTVPAKSPRLGKL